MFREKLMNNTFNEARLDSIQILRGIAAMLIVIGHSTFLRGSPVGVEIFFCVSGFIMMYVTQNNASKFLPKRVIRIIPLYWGATMLTYLLGVILQSADYAYPDTIFTIKSLFFMTNGMPLHTIGWTLNFEVIFYILFYIACRISIKYRGLIVCAFLGMWIFIRAELLFYHSVSSRPYFVTMPLCFAYGILAFYVIKFAYSKREKIREIKPACAIWILFAVLWTLSKFAENISWAKGNFTFLRPLAYGIPAFVLVCCLSVLFIPVNADAASPPRIWRKILLYIGNCSYSLYLCHTFILHLFKYIFTKLNLFSNAHNYFKTTIPNIGFTVIVCIASLACAAILYELIELRLTNRLRRLFRI
jgi:exopolysaccharide production protein ExoZ